MAVLDMPQRHLVGFPKSRRYQASRNRAASMRSQRSCAGGSGSGMPELSLPKTK